MQGEIVIVRAYGNVPVFCRIWEIKDRIIYVTNDEELKLLLAGDKSVQPIGIPREDVFKYTPKLAKSIGKNNKKDGYIWEKLVPYE